MAGPYCLSSASNYKRHQSKWECSVWDHVHRSMSHAWPIIVARRWGNTGQTSESEPFQHRSPQLRWILFFFHGFPLFRSVLIGRKRLGGKGCNYLQESSNNLWVSHLNSCKKACVSHILYQTLLCKVINIQCIYIYIYIYIYIHSPPKYWNSEANSFIYLYENIWVWIRDKRSAFHLLFPGIHIWIW